MMTRLLEITSCIHTYIHTDIDTSDTEIEEKQTNDLNRKEYQLIRTLTFATITFAIEFVLST